MVKATIDFYVPRQRRVERLSPGGDPVENGSFETFGVVRSCAGRAFLYLSHYRVRCGWKGGGPKQTNSAINTTSSSVQFIKRSSKPGTICRSFVKTRCSFRSLIKSSQIWSQTLDAYDILSCKVLLRRLHKFHHTKQAISDECLYLCHGMNRAAEVATVMYQRV